MNPLIAAAVSLFIRLVIGSSVFKRIEAEVHRWAERQISGAEKREGIMAELEIIGIKGAEWAFRTAIELAIGKLVDFDATIQPQAADFAKIKANKL